MLESLIIAPRFQGPPHSGNGGYVCGRLARYIDGPATVRLKQPPPLETELKVSRRAEGVVLLLYGDRTIAEARPAPLSLEVPPPPSPAETRDASQRYPGFQRHPFPGCFVCGPERGDGLRIFPGPLLNRPIVAAPWTPDSALADRRGMVPPEILWAALDCSGAFTFEWPRGRVVLLGELSACLAENLPAGVECIVIGWELGREGRKHWTGTAIFNAAGACIARARATWFEVPGRA